MGLNSVAASQPYLSAASTMLHGRLSAAAAIRHGGIGFDWFGSRRRGWRRAGTAGIGVGGRAWVCPRVRLAFHTQRIYPNATAASQRMISSAARPMAKFSKSKTRSSLGSLARRLLAR
jgi:hypothetical protein